MIECDSNLMNYIRGNAKAIVNKVCFIVITREPVVRIERFVTLITA